MAAVTLPAEVPARFSPFVLVQSSRQGMMRSQVDEVAALVGLTDREMVRRYSRLTGGFGGCPTKYGLPQNGTAHYGIRK